MKSLTELEKIILMELQYRFAVEAPDPYEYAAFNLGISESTLLEVLLSLKKRGVLKRIGFYLNPRSLGQSVSLVAFKGGDVQRARLLCMEDPRVTHCYEREHNEWRIWVVRRGEDLGAIHRWALSFSKSIGADAFEVLPARRLVRLSVKYDLYRGISRAGPFSLVQLNPPDPTELGVSVKLLEELRSLPITRDPYRVVGEKLGLKPDDVIEAVRVCLRHGVLGDPGAVLNGHEIGFKLNVMIVAYDVDCVELASRIPEATHVVERFVYPPDTKPRWAPACYMMIHAVNEASLEYVYKRLREMSVNFEALVSVRDLKPGAAR